MKINQKGQIAVLLPILILIAGLFLFNLSKKENPETSCMVGENAPERVLNLPMIKNPEGVVGSEGGPDTSSNRNYRLVRLKVPIDPWDAWYKNKYLLPHGGPPYGDNTLHFLKYQNITIDGVVFEIYYPNHFGESTLDRKFISRYEGETDQFRFHQEGILFFLRLKPDGTPETVKGLDRETNQEKDFWLVDLYQEEGRYNASLTQERGYTQADVFRCQRANSTRSFIIEQPSPGVGGGKQLQLNYFKIRSDLYGFSAHCKPAIYLYPEKTEKVNVKVKTKGELLYTKPLYPSAGWDVTAYPNGKIVYKGQNLEYLYYESRIPDNLVEKPRQGFVVEYQRLPELFNNLLPKLGLSSKQVFDFKDYWEKVLPKSNYYFVGVLSENNLNSFEPLTIDPRPDTVIRVRLYFEALEKKINVQEPEIKMPEKNGFTVIEWGGMVKRDKNHPFTCSE